MKSHLLVDWWGFRLRFPLDYNPKPVTRVELLAFFTMLSAGCIAIWFLFSLIAWPDMKLSFLDIAAPSGITVFFLVLGLFIPRFVSDRMGISTLMILARESGRTRRWDIGISFLAVISITLGVAFRQPHWVVWVFAAFSFLVGAILLGFFQERIDFSKRRKEWKPPPWLLKEEQNDQDKENELQQDDGEEEPSEIDESKEQDGNERHQFQLHVKEKGTHSLSVKIPLSVLEQLRIINTSWDPPGELFLKNMQSLVLMDRPPARDIGRIEVQDLCSQIFRIAEQYQLTRPQLATLVLNFVQEAIEYQLDKSSTCAFPGGPYEEYGRFALETLNDRVGDCECTALLALSLLAYLGFEVALLLIEFDDGGYHAAVGLCIDDLYLNEEYRNALNLLSTTYNGKSYLYGETAIDGMTMGFGDLPAEWVGKMRIQNVMPVERVS